MSCRMCISFLPILHSSKPQQWWPIDQVATVCATWRHQDIQASQLSKLPYNLEHTFRCHNFHLWVFTVMQHFTSANTTVYQIPKSVQINKVVPSTTSVTFCFLIQAAQNVNGKLGWPGSNVTLVMSLLDGCTEVIVSWLPPTTLQCTFLICCVSSWTTLQLSKTC